MACPSYASLTDLYQDRRTEQPTVPLARDKRHLTRSVVETSEHLQRRFLLSDQVEPARTGTHQGYVCGGC